MAQPRYQIFVSSTFRDLKEEREAVLNAILKLNQFPAGMELFPATNDNAWQHIEKVIKDSDYYVLVIGGKYGSMDETGISYTEKEYDFAISQNIPVLAFTHSDEENIPFGKVEKSEEAREKLKNFKQKVGSRHHWNYWKTIDELKANVISSLSMIFVMNPQNGWVKTGGIEKTEMLKRLAELQRKYDKLLTDYNKIKSSYSQNLLDGISQGDEEITLKSFKDSDEWDSFEATCSWNDLFLCTAKILIKSAKTSTYNFVEELFYYLSGNRYGYSSKNYLWESEVKVIINQFVALDLVKTGFDRQDRPYFALTEKGRKLYALQTAIKNKTNNK
jgi:hypothetical protein